MDKKVLVAICVPYYRKFKSLIRLIQSIERQTFTDYIVIVSDDSMDDNARNYIEELDERYIYIRNKERKGATANCNYAMMEVQKYQPQFIKVMHHDDYFSQDDSLEKFVLALQDNQEAIFAFSNVYVEYEGENDTYIRKVKSEELEEIRRDKYTLVEKNVIGAPSTVMVRNKRIYMDDNLMWLVDLEWYIKLLEYKNQFAYIPDALITIGIDGNRVTDECLKNLELIQREYIYTFLKHYQIPKNNIIETVIAHCVRYYEGEAQKGYFCKGEYLAIIKDALCDGKKICICGDMRLKADVENTLRSAFKINEFYYMDIDENNMDDMKWDVSNIENIQRDVLCIIIKENAKAIRKFLNSKGINAVPYIKKYLL